MITNMMSSTWTTMLRSLKAFTLILIFKKNPEPESDFGINNVRLAQTPLHKKDM